MYQKTNLVSLFLENAVDQIATLPGIGNKSALRLALFILKQPKENVKKFTDSIESMRNKIVFCSNCFMVSDSDICPICSDEKRDKTILCVVESIRDVLSIENTGQYNGQYHILGGVISPIEGIGPNEIKIKELINRLENQRVKEVIFALNTKMEGETTSFYLYKKLEKFNIVISAIARGISFGDDLEYADELSLAKSIINRQIFK